MTLDLAEGARLVVDSGRLYYEHRDQRDLVPCTDPAGTGDVRALALHPAGIAYVAAGRGIFALDAEHRILDAPTLGSGVPAGSPVDLHVDDEARLWLLTESEFGVVDTRFWFGRVLDRVRDTLPGPFRSLVAARDGRLCVQHGVDAWAEYQPDAGPPPTGQLRGVGPTDTLRGDSAGHVEVELDTRARGETMLRWRRGGTHLLRELEDDRLVTGLRPGKHEIEFWAIDQDLQATRLARVPVDIPYPPRFDFRRLPLVGAAGMLLWTLAWLLLARCRAGGQPGWVRKATLSATLSGVLALLALSCVLGYGKAWPFIGFSMYSEKAKEMTVLYRPRIYALRAEGDEPKEVTAEMAGLRSEGHWEMAGELAFDEQRRRLFLSRLQRRNRHLHATGLLVVDQRTRLTRRGPQRVAPNVLLSWTPQ